MRSRTGILEPNLSKPVSRVRPPKSLDHRFSPQLRLLSPPNSSKPRNLALSLSFLACKRGITLALPTFQGFGERLMKEQMGNLIKLCVRVSCCSLPGSRPSNLPAFLAEFGNRSVERTEIKEYKLTMTFQVLLVR